MDHQTAWTIARDRQRALRRAADVSRLRREIRDADHPSAGRRPRPPEERTAC